MTDCVVIFAGLASRNFVTIDYFVVPHADRLDRVDKRFPQRQIFAGRSTILDGEPVRIGMFHARRSLKVAVRVRSHLVIDGQWRRAVHASVDVDLVHNLPHLVLVLKPIKNFIHLIIFL
jgi:hypothetical protein